MTDEANSDKLLDKNDSWSNCDDWDEDSDEPSKCPFCEQVLTSASGCFEHTKSVHAFDFNALRMQLSLDFYECIKMVNYARLNRKLTMTEAVNNAGQWRQDKKYLTPVLENDPLLYAFDDDSESNVEVATQLTGDSQQLVEQLRNQLEAEKKTNAALKEAFQSYKEMAETSLMSKQLKAEIENGLKTETVPKHQDAGNYYFESYAGNEIHETMLKDTVRTEGYRDFVYNNKGYFNGKIVLDVGCGTGILSMFAAKAGAKHVYAIDNSDIILKAREIAKENNLADKITFLKGRAEDIELPVDKVDIIISEWMGYFLLFEGMLDSVLHVRDKYLKPTGIMAPSCTKIFLAAFGDAEWYESTVNFWTDVYGFKMNTMSVDSKKNGFVTVVDGKHLISDSVLLSDIDTKSVTIPQLDFTTKFEMKINTSGKIYAFCGWFDTFFEGNGIDTVMFSTSPTTKPTHWMQTMFILEEPLAVEENEVVVGEFVCKKSTRNPRELDITIEYQIKGKDAAFTQHFGVV